MSLAELTDARLEYHLSGCGAPLILVPGLGSTRSTYASAIDNLSDHFTVISINNRGIGESVAKRPPTRLHDYAADIVELLDHLQIERAHVLGLSLGGMIAQRFAMDHAPRLDRLVLMSTAHRFSPYLRETAMMIGRALRHLPRREYVRFVELIGVGPRAVDLDPEMLDQKVADVMARKVPRHAVVAQLRAMGASDPTEDEFNITAPTLVVAGEHDALIPPCYGRDMADAIGPHAHFHIVPDTGHNPFTECPDLVLPLVRDFLVAPQDASGDGDRAAA